MTPSPAAVSTGRRCREATFTPPTAFAGRMPTVCVRWLRAAAEPSAKGCGFPIPRLPPAFQQFGEEALAQPQAIAELMNGFGVKVWRIGDFDGLHRQFAGLTAEAVAQFSQALDEQITQSFVCRVGFSWGLPHTSLSDNSRRATLVLNCLRRVARVASGRCP